MIFEEDSEKSEDSQTLVQKRFAQDKVKQLERKDPSDEGKWDDAIKDACEKLNKSENFYTTSSCSGRIVLIKALEEKAEGVFLFKSHEKISFNQLKRELERISKEYKDEVYFKQETCIIVAGCKTIEDAQKLVDKFKEAGWKRTGIMASRKRIIVEAMSTEYMSLPIMDKGKILVDDDYLRRIVREANRRLERVREKIKRFEKLL